MVEVNPIAPPVEENVAGSPDEQTENTGEQTENTGSHKGPPKKSPYPGLAVNEKGKATVKLEKVPGDFDKAKHVVLRRVDFKDETVWLEMRATDCEASAVEYRREVEMLRKLGDSTTQAKAKSLIAMQKKVSELRKQLEGVGVSVDEL
jgi:hypothetical protein